MGAAPDGYSHVDTDRHSDSTKEGNVQTHKGYMGKTITTGNEIKPKLEKKKGNIIFYFCLLLIPIICHDDDVSHALICNIELNLNFKLDSEFDLKFDFELNFIFFVS